MGSKEKVVDATLQTALEAIAGLTPDELFETFLRTYLDAVLSQIPGRVVNAE